MSEPSAAQASIHRILELWDRYENVVADRESSDAEAHSLVRSDLQTKILAEIEANHATTLAALRLEAKLEPTELLIVLLLLRRMLREPGPALDGRTILRHFFDGTFDALRGLRYLTPQGPLRTRGIVECVVDGGAAGALEARFALSEKFFESLYRETNDIPADTDKSPVPGERAYADNIEYLLDLRDLCQLCRRRAEKVFGGAESHDDSRGSDDTGGVELLVREKLREIEERLEQTPDADQFAATRFLNRHRLANDEWILVLTLVFQELFAGNAYADPIDALKLVCSRERDLLVKRKILAPESTLIERDILSFDDPGTSRELAGEISLAPWALEAVLGKKTAGEAIDADARLDFHEYLKDMPDSNDFFTKLRLPPRKDP